MEKPVAVVTGGSKGLGAVLTRFLGAQGYSVIINARGSAALQVVERDVLESGGRIRALNGDIQDAAHRVDLIAEARKWQRMALLINNASSLDATPLPALEDYPLGSLERLFKVNVLAPLALIQLALPLMRQTGGLIINIISDAATSGYPGWGGYGSAKAALDSMTLTLANELQGSGLGIVSVDPGDLQTDIHQKAFPSEDISDRPSPEVTLPFFAWLLGKDPRRISGRRFEAQAERWEIPA